MHVFYRNKVMEVALLGAGDVLQEKATRSGHVLLKGRLKLSQVGPDFGCSFLSLILPVTCKEPFPKLFSLQVTMFAHEVDVLAPFRVVFCLFICSDWPVNFFLIFHGKCLDAPKTRHLQGMVPRSLSGALLRFLLGRVPLLK